MPRLFQICLLLLILPTGGAVLACSTHGTNEFSGISVQYGDPDGLGRIKVKLGIDSTLVEPAVSTICVAGVGLGNSDSALPAEIKVTGVELQIFNRSTGAIAVLENFDFSPDAETSDGLSRGSSGSGVGDPRPLIDGATWFGFSTDVGPFELTLADNETVRIMFELDLPLDLLPLATQAQFAAGEGQADGTPVFNGDHPVSYFTGVAPDVVLSLFKINAGLNDAWVSADAPLQGFFFTVFPDIGFFFLSWFTFDSVPPVGGMAVFGADDQRWVTGGGVYLGDTVTINVELTSGGIFNASTPMAVQQPGYGTITVVFISCNEAALTYDFPSGGLSGHMALTRVVTDNVTLCEALAVP